MNNWLNRLERRYGRFGIPNLTNILVGGQILVLAIELFVNQTISVWLSLSRYLLLSGQIWRIITFVFIPSYAHRRQRQHLLPVPLAAAGLCHAVPGGTGAAVLCDPYPGEVFWLFCGDPVGAELFGRTAAPEAEPAAQHGECLAVLWPHGLPRHPCMGPPGAVEAEKQKVRRKTMMLDRMEGNAELKSSVQLMLAARRLTHSVLLVGEEGLGAGFAARCIAADYLYPAGGAPAEALLRGECCRAVAKAGKRDSGQVETGIVREAISVTGMGAGGRYLVGQVSAMRSEIFNTSLSAEGRAVLLYHVEKMNEESANALLKVMEEPPEGVLFLLTADSLAGVLPTIRSRCISFAVAPVPPEQCARYCAAQGVDKKTAALYSELFDGHIGTVLAAAQDEARTAQVEKALQLAKTAADRDSYAAAVLLAPYEKDKAGAAALLTDFRAVAAAGLRQSPHAPVQGDAARRALRLADAAIQRLGAQVNPKIVLSVFAAKFRAL